MTHTELAPAKRQVSVKLYNARDTGRVLVILDRDEEGNALRFRVCPRDVTCTVTLYYSLTDAGLGNARKAFAEVDEAFALKAMRGLMNDKRLAPVLRGVGR